MITITGVWIFLFMWMFFYGITNLVMDIFSIVMWIKDKKKEVK